MRARLRFLLLQARDAHDPMRGHEVDCFARVLQVARDQIGVFDLITEPLDGRHLKETDVFLLGGSGDYSVAAGEHWLDRALDSLREIHAARAPTFASCWGFQAMASAMGGRVVHDPEHAEIGTHGLYLTEAGREDPVFSILDQNFMAQMGHQDRVLELPPNTTLLASTESVAQQAFRFDDAPIYCTQFHPELEKKDLVLRFQRYPKYIEQFTHMPFEEFVETFLETRESEALLPRFLEVVLG